MHMPDNDAFTSRQYVDIDKMRVAGGPGPAPTEAAKEGIAETRGILSLLP